MGHLMNHPRVPAGPVLVALLVLAVVVAGCVDGEGEREERELSASSSVQRFDPPVEAPDYSVTTINGDEFTLADQEGKVVMMYFFGVGCTSCAANLPAHRQLYESHGDDEHFVMVAINAWSVWYGEGEQEMRDYREKEEIRWAMAPSSDQLNQEYDVRGTPTHYFIDHEGLAQASGYRLSYDVLSGQVDQMLEEIGS